MLADEDSGNGESRTADRQIAAANFPKEADEQVLVQAKGDGARRPTRASRSPSRTPTQRLKRTKYVTKVESPLAKGNEGQISKDGRSALVTFKIPGDDDVAKDRVDADASAAAAAAQRAHPELRIEQFGDASADKALDEVVRQRLQEGRVRSRSRSR